MNKLSSRAIIGEFFKRLNADDGMAWIGAISNYFTSDQDTEEYAWIGQSPVMREWIGGRHAKDSHQTAFPSKTNTLRQRLTFRSNTCAVIKPVR